MKLFFSILLACLPFFAAFSQDSTVCIEPKVARWYLEANDERWVLREKDSLNTELITNLGDQLLVKDQIIDTYQEDSISYNSREATFLEQLRLTKEELEGAGKRVRREKALKYLALLGIIIAAIL